MLTALEWLALVVLIAANGLFVSAEFSLTSVDRARITRLAESGDRRAQTVLTSVRQLSFQLSGAQLGITICSLLLGFVAEPVIADALRSVFEPLGISDRVASPLAIGLALFLATVAQMLFGELVPQNLAIARSIAVSRAVTPLQRGFVRVFGPVILLFNNTANLIVRRLGIEPQEELRAARTPAELGHLIGSSAEEGVLPVETATLLRRALSFGDRTAEDIMTPRVQVVALRVDQTAADLLSVARGSGHSRFPVHAGDPDDVVGVIQVKHAFRIPLEQRTQVQVSELLVEPLRVPTSLDCDALLVELRRYEPQLAVVVDEFGGTAGVVTVEDLVEELLGAVLDEHDTGEAPEVLALSDGTWSVSGRLHRDLFAEELGLTDPPGHYETLAGLILVRLGRLAEPNDVVDVDGWRLTVTRVDRRRIDRVRVVPPAREPAPEPHGSGPRR